MSTTRRELSVWVTWGLVLLLALFVLVKGAFTFLVVGDLGPPTWDYHIIEDVPGQSPYAMYEPLPSPQHVRGDRGE